MSARARGHWRWTTEGNVLATVDADVMLGWILVCSAGMR